MNVIMNCAKMIGLAANHRLQRRDNFLGALFRRAVRAPESPGMQVHSGFGEQRGGIKIVGEALHHVAHRSEEHTSELQSHSDLVCRLLLEKKKKNIKLSTKFEVHFLAF